MAQTSTGLINFALYVIFCYFPSLLIVIVCTLWSCAIYKKSYTVSHDSDLDRRIISMPIVLPLILITPTLLSATILGGIRQVLVSLNPRDLPNWILFTRFMISHLHVVVPRIVYPFILLKLNPPIARHWKELKKVLKYERHSQVEPIISTTVQVRDISNSTTITATRIMV